MKARIRIETTSAFDAAGDEYLIYTPYLTCRPFASGELRLPRYTTPAPSHYAFDPADARHQLKAAKLGAIRSWEAMTAMTATLNPVI